MRRFWHRVAVYFGLREDPDLNARLAAADRPDAKALAVRLPIAAVIGIAGFSLLVLLDRLLSGGDTGLESVVAAAARRFLLLLAVWAAVFVIRLVVRRLDGSEKEA